MPERVKLVWFVPLTHLDATRDAVFAAGGGHIGGYSRCSWWTVGTGSFVGGDGTSPFLGRAGTEEHVTEARVETVVSGGDIAAVVAALRGAHPYEEPAYDVHPLLDVG